MTKYWKQALRSAMANAANALPLSSGVIGAPRKTGLAEKGPFERQVLRQETALTEKPPRTLDEEVFFKFPPLYKRVQPVQFVVKLEGGRVWGNNGAVITADDIFLSDISKEFGPAKFDPSRHSIFSRIKLRKPERFNGSVAVIASPGSGVYAHWMADILPRIVLLKEAGVLDKADKILINYDRLDFQLETLSRMGIPESRLINCIKDLDFHLSADTLYVPSYPNAHGTVNQWACQAARGIFREERKADAAMPARLYISRSRAVGRRILNEEEVFSFLHHRYGFEKVFTEDYDMAEKARIFGQAECIVAPHGGGVTNIIFSRAGAKVVDIFPPGDFDTFFWSMANSNEMEYFYFFGKGEMPSPQNDFMKRNVDIEVDMDRFKALMDLVKLEK